MNCDAARRLLLGDEQPDRPTDDDVRRHLAACPACRVWGRRLAHVERQLPRLPVPPSSARPAFVRRFLRTGGPVVRRVPVPWHTPPKERGLQKLSLAVAIAAVLAVFTVVWWSGPRVPSAPTHPEPSLVAQIRTERDRIRAVPAAPERIVQLGALATYLHDQALALTQKGDADGLASLAKVYAALMAEDLLPQAHGLSATQRAAVLTRIAEKLHTEESEFGRMAAAKADNATAGPLHDLDLAALDAFNDIQDLLKTA